MQTLKPIIFFGSGPVAAASLAKLITWQPVHAVITKRTPPHHKEIAPVETFAQNANIPLYFADNKKELDELVTNKDFYKTDYGIVIDYGVIISESTIQAFPKGIINSHFSLLPEWRGADPITYSLLSGQQTTGVSIMLIDKGLDTGPLLATGTLPIESADTNQTLTDKLITLSDSLLQQTLPAYAKGTVLPRPQPTTIATYSQMLSKKSGILNCSSRTASELERQICAFAGWPNSRLEHKGVWLTITKASVAEESITPGELVIKGGALLLGCKEHSLYITELQPAGKKAMSATAFINGYAQKLEIQTI